MYTYLRGKSKSHLIFQRGPMRSINQRDDAPRRLGRTPVIFATSFQLSPTIIHLFLLARYPSDLASLFACRIVGGGV